jgi:hypothetical protein
VSFRIFGKVLGWCDTTEEQARFLLHSHVLLFIEFDALVSMLWSNCDMVRESGTKRTYSVYDENHVLYLYFSG